MATGEGRRLELAVSLDAFELGGERYAATPSPVPVTLEISRTTQSGYALRLRFGAGLRGPCMRCLTDAAPQYTVDAWEISQPNSGEELDSPYLLDGALSCARGRTTRSPSCSEPRSSAGRLSRTVPGMRGSP